MKHPNSYKNRLATIITLVLILPGFQLNAQNSAKKTKHTVEYSIDDKKVSVKEFDKFLTSLKEIEGTWFCAETRTGGITGYNAKDKSGTVYEYRAESDAGNSVNTIRKKPVLK